MLKFNKHLAKVHAYLCADGYVTTNQNIGKKHYTIGFRNTSDILLSDFESNFKNFFGINSKRQKDNRSLVYSKDIYSQLTQQYSYYSIDWQMPKISKKLYPYWLQAFFDCESWVISRKAQDRHIGIDSISQKGLMDVKNYLKKLGISCKFKYIGKRSKNQNEISRLLIFGKTNLQVFQRKINFLHPVKKLKLQMAIESYVDYDWKIRPEECVNQESAIRKILQSKKGFKKRGSYSICSIKKYNLIYLQKFLKKELNIKSSIYGPKRNTKGCKYYEFNILNKEQAKKLKNFIYPQ